MRALVTGGNGFVGKHLCAALRAPGNEAIVAAHAGHARPEEIDIPLDLSDLDNVRGAVELAEAEVVFHLAAQAYVPAATRDPLNAYDINALGTARLYEAIRTARRQPRLVLFVSSAEVYGSREASAYPLVETLDTRPMTPYAASKVAGEAIALASMRTYGVPTIVVRAFNHIGPGQDERFSVPSFAAQLATIADGGEPVLRVGNLEAQRDFLDVRDVVRAYVALAERGTPGEIYNVCSDKPTSMREILRSLIMIAGIPVEVRDDPERWRPSDVPLSYGTSSKLREATGWTPERTLIESLRDVYADVRGRVRAGT